MAFTSSIHRVGSCSFSSDLQTERLTAAAVGADAASVVAGTASACKGVEEEVDGFIGETSPRSSNSSLSLRNDPGNAGIGLNNTNDVAIDVGLAGVVKADDNEMLLNKLSVVLNDDDNELLLNEVSGVLNELSGAGSVGW